MAIDTIPPPEIIRVTDAPASPATAPARFRPRSAIRASICGSTRTGYVECGYCDRRFVLKGGPADSQGRHDRAPIPAASSTASLDPDAREAARRDALSRYDDGELYLQYSASESFGFDDGRLKTADYHTQAGFGLRGVSGETTAFAHANEISEAAIDRAAATLKLLDPRQGRAAAAAARGPTRRCTAPTIR